MGIRVTGQKEKGREQKKERIGEKSQQSRKI